MKYIYIFIVIIFLKFLINLLQFLKNPKLHKIWKRYFENLANKKIDNNAITYTEEIVKNFKTANIHDISIPMVEPVGYGQIATSQISAFTNIFANDKTCFTYINDAFLMAHGVYRKRMLDSFNPFFWLDFIIKLPKYIIEYLGLDSQTVFTKIFQLIYWIIDSFLLVCYREPILNYLQDFISKLFK